MIITFISLKITLEISSNAKQDFPIPKIPVK